MCSTNDYQSFIIGKEYPCYDPSMIRGSIPCPIAQKTTQKTLSHIYQKNESTGSLPALIANSTVPKPLSPDEE